MAPADNGID